MTDCQDDLLSMQYMQAAASEWGRLLLHLILVSEQVLFNCIVPLCASNWILLKLTEKLIDPSTFSLLRSDPSCNSLLQADQPVASVSRVMS